MPKKTQPFWSYVMELSNLFEVDHRITHKAADILWPHIQETDRFYYRTVNEDNIFNKDFKKRDAARREDIQNAKPDSWTFTEKILIQKLALEQEKSNLQKRVDFHHEAAVKKTDMIQRHFAALATRDAEIAQLRENLQKLQQECDTLKDTQHRRPASYDSEGDYEVLWTDFDLNLNLPEQREITPCSSDSPVSPTERIEQLQLQVERLTLTANKADRLEKEVHRLTSLRKNDRAWADAVLAASERTSRECNRLRRDLMQLRHPSPNNLAIARGSSYTDNY